MKKCEVLNLKKKRGQYGSRKQSELFCMKGYLCYTIKLFLRFQDLFKIETNEKVGRYAAASQNLKPGDVIFSEKPFAYGPKADTYPLCLGCYNAADGSVLCSSCGWPVCNPQCEINPAHKNAECAVFSKAGVKFQPVEDPAAVCLQYECITPLR